MDSSERSDTLVSGAGDNNQQRGEGDAVAEAAAVAGFVGKRWLRVMEDHIDGEVANLMERSEAGEVVDHRSKGESVVSDDDNGRKRSSPLSVANSIFGRSSSIIELWGNNFGVLGKIHLKNFIWAPNFINKIQDAELEVRVVVETEMSSLEVKVVAKRLNWERLRELIAKVGRSGRREVERIGRHRNCHRRWGEDDVIMRNVVQRQQEQLQLRLWHCKSVEACGGGHGEELGGGNGEVWDQSELHFSVQ
nr:TMV resistance protein N-like [Ipomoea trifida]